MTHDRILQNVAKHIRLDEVEEERFVSLLGFREVPKKAFLLKEGQLCRSISYVHSGALRAYYMDKEGKDATIMFAISDWWITDMFCFVSECPAMMNVEAIEDSCVFQLSRDKRDGLFREIPKFERFFRILMQNAYTREQLRVMENLSLPAENRYDNFLQKYPRIAEQVTQKQIASYLGITPEFLSMIRKNKSRRPRS
ncbi:Crp/Fnr family transcriptional regulator [Puia sp. P3]|uniref:Crp/Fnr family transcriptional regulator n=1 Tax=Puia sp. P3 TaxID=3423952 RepID=UPI003D66DF75